MQDDIPRRLPRATDIYSIDNLDEPISDEVAFRELANALTRLRGAFIKAGFEPPKAIELASHEDGFRLRHILPREMIYATTQQGRLKDSDDVVMNIVGVELRYPAKHRRDGKRYTVL